VLLASHQYHLGRLILTHLDYRQPPGAGCGRWRL
jgi:hypothetical protein